MGNRSDPNKSLSQGSVFEQVQVEDSRRFLPGAGFRATPKSAARGWAQAGAGGSGVEPGVTDRAGGVLEQRAEGVRAVKADHAERLVALAEFLSPEDRALVRAVYAHGRPITESAALLGVDRRRLGARLQRIVGRCLSPEFAFVVSRKDHWTGPLWRVSEACVLRGLTLRAAARELRLTVHAVRRQRAIAQAMYRGAREVEGLLRTHRPPTPAHGD